MKRRMAWWLIGASMMSTVLLAPGYASGQEEPDERAVLRDYYSGNGLLNRGLYDLAAREYRKFLDAHPDHDKAAVARYGLAVCQFRLGRFEDAAGELETLADLDDFEFAAESVMILGQSRHALGEYDAAAAACGTVLEAHLDHDLAPNAAVLQAEALYRAGKYGAAGRPCELFVATWPDHPLRERAELFRGLAEMARGDFDTAAGHFDEMLGRFPDGQYSGQASLMLAQCLHRTRGLGRALTLYQKVIEDAGDEFVPDALYGLALLMFQQDDSERAGELVDELLDRYPESELVTNARLLRGRVHFTLGEYDAAMETLSDIADVEGDHLDDAEYWMAKCRLRQNDPAAAADRFDAAIERFPDSELMAEMMYDRSIALLRAGREDEALAALVAFRQSFHDHPLSAEALQLMAATLHQQGEYDRSAQCCAEFRDAYPEHDLIESVDFLAAENQFLTRDYETAIGSYRGFLRRHVESDDAEKATFRLGMAQYQLGDFENAEANLLDVVAGAETPEAFRSALLALGDGYFQRGDWSRAETFLSEYLTADDPASADDALLKLGLAFHRQGKREPGIEQYERLIEDYPESPHRLQAIFERGQALVALEDDEAARRAFERVVDAGGESDLAPHALNHLGSIALRAGDYQEAAGHFDSAALAHTDDDLAAEALFQAGQAKMALRQFEAAQQTFATILADHPAHKRVGQASALEAIALARLDDHERALDHIADVEREYIEDIDAGLSATMYYEKAWCLRALNRVDDAAVAYRGVLGLDRRDDLHKYAMLELAELQADAENHEGAATLLERLLDLSAETEETSAEILEQATYRLGVSQFRLEQYEDAADTLDTFIDEFGDSDLVASAGLLCGEALIKTGRNRVAADHLTAVVENHEDSDAYGPALLRLGEATAALSLWPRSEQVFGMYLQALPDSDLWFQAQFGVGYAQENQQQYEEAISSYRQVVDRHEGPTAARAQFQIGECLYALKRYDDAAAELLKVDILYAYPEWSAAALFEAGRCFEELADPVQARKQFEQVVNAYGETEWARLAGQRLEALSKVNLPGHAGGN